MKIKARETFTDIRIRKGYSITGLAKAMKTNASVVFNLEKGGGIRPATARKASEALNEDFDTLFIIRD